MSERRSCLPVAFLLLLTGLPAVHAGAARHHERAVTPRRSALSWSRVGLRHVSPQDVLEALQRGREWRALLHGSRGRLLAGVALVIPSRRDDALLVRGTRDGVRQLREIVGLLDTPERKTPVGRGPGTVTRAYQMALQGEWRGSIAEATSVLARTPEDAAASALQAYSLVKSSEPNRAETLVTRALHQTEGMSGRARALALCAEGALAEAHGDKRGAVSAFQSAGNADESCALPYLAFADYAHAHGRDDTARKLLQGGLPHVKTPAERAAIRARLGGL